MKRCTSLNCDFENPRRQRRLASVGRGDGSDGAAPPAAGGPDRHSRQRDWTLQTRQQTIKNLKKKDVFSAGKGYLDGTSAEEGTFRLKPDS